MVQEHRFAICDGPHSFAQAHRRLAGLLSASSGLTAPPVATLSTGCPSWWWKHLSGSAELAPRRYALRWKSLMWASKSGLSGIHADDFCVCTRWLFEGLGLLPRYDLISQAGKSLQPLSPPPTQAFQSNMVYLLREECSGFCKHGSAADKR